MSESKFTPGPWFWESEVLCNVDFLVGGREHSFKESNKSLIAAAPDLLEALQDALHAYDKHGEHSEWDSARAAIAKALGQ